MALIAFDATANSGYQAASSSYNFNLTVGSNNNRLLVVSVALLNVVNSVTALTYNSVSLTKLRSDVDGTGTIRTEIWYLVAPATGTNSVAVTLNTASVSGTAASSYYNVDQGNPVDAQNGGTGTTGAGGGSASVSTTTVIGNNWIVDAVATVDTSITVGSGQTQRANITGAVGSGGQSDKGPNSAGSVTMQWDNIGALLNWTMSTMSIRPSIDSNVSDTVVTTESLNHYSDQVDVNELVRVLTIDNVNVSDSVATSESVGMFESVSINVSDTIATSESTVELINSFINVSDSITTAESRQIATTENLTVNDTVTSSESIQVTISSSLIVVSDSISALESLNHYSDQVDVMESFTVDVQAVPTLLITISNSIILTEKLDIIRDNTRDIIISGDNRLLDENGNFILDENGNFILDETPGEIVSVTESIQAYTYKSFIDVESLILTIPNSISTPLVIPGAINLKIIIE